MSTMNTITADFVTNQDTALFPVVGERYIDSLRDHVWTPKVVTATKVKAASITLGATLFIIFLILFLFSLFLVFESMFVIIPGVSTKFAVFLALLSGGFAGELLYARKLKNE